MTKYRVDQLNSKIDEIYSLMLKRGYNRKELNKRYLMFNLLGFSEERKAFMHIFKQLRLINEKAENFEICALILKEENKLKEIKKEYEKS